MELPTIRDAKPPIYDRVLATFGITEKDVQANWIIFAYEGEIWNPTGNHITADRVVHEVVHFKQQNIGGVDISESWWDRYLTDAHFRLNQEVEAYSAQYWWARETWSDRNTVAKLLDFIAKALSSKMYGNLVTYQEAVRLIKLA